MNFPYGKAPLCILALAIVSGIAIIVMRARSDAGQPDLTFALFARNHHSTYISVVEEFQKKRGVQVQMQLVTGRALQSRLQSALLADADVPDVVEIVNGSMGYFTKGPIEDVGFIDLTDRIRSEGWDERLVASRFSLWSSRGHIFALPHDVHPVALAYRSDIVEDELDIDVGELKTWDDFAAMGRKITKDLDGDGMIDRYALELPTNGSHALNILILQRGGGLFNANGEVIFDSDIVADTICWYVEQTHGPQPIGTTAGGGQAFTQTLLEGRVLFYFAPDWRTKMFSVDAPSLEGKMKLMPLPVWEEGGRRTSTWGGTGLAITKRCKNPDLAWEFAKFLYFDKPELGKRFDSLNILPPLKDAWDLPEFAKPRPYYSNQPIGTILADLAPETPDDYVHAYSELARRKLDEAYGNSRIYFGDHDGGEGMREFVRGELKRCADYVRKTAARNVFLVPGGQAGEQSDDNESNKGDASR